MNPASLSSRALPFFALLLVSQVANATGPEIAEQSAVAAGSGGASTARSGEPGAAYFNPAALADGRGLRVGLGSAFALASLTAKSAEGALEKPYEVSSEGALRAIPNIALSYAYKDFVGGVATNVPYASSVFWPETSPLRFETVSSALRDIRIAPFVGFRYKWFRVAAGPNFDVASLEVKRATNHVTEEGKVHLLLNGAGYGAQIALFAEPSERLRFGLSYKSRSVLVLSGDADFTVPPVFGYADQGVTARFYLPDRIALGAAYRYERVHLLADLIYSTWSVNERLTFTFEQGTPSPSTLKNEWRDALAIRVGAEVDANRWLTLRGGAFVDGVPGPAAPVRNLAPNAPDATRIGGSLGAGANVALKRNEKGTSVTSLGVDVFYSLLALLERTSTSDSAPLATYSGIAHFFGLGVRFNWNHAGTEERAERGAAHP